MVRQLSIGYAYKKHGTQYKEESAETKLALALIAANHSVGSGRTITALSPLTVPYWIVQVAPSRSVLISATGIPNQSLTFTENNRLAEFRRVLSSEIGEPGDVPAAVGKLQSLLGSVQTSTHKLEAFQDPSFLTMVGKFVLELDPNATPNRPEMRVDSNSALEKSQQFQKLMESCRTRVNALEDLRRLTRERLQNQLSVIENLMATERSRWEQRVRALEERTRQDIDTLRKKESDGAYEMREKHKIAVRAITADFNRTAADIERLFVEGLELVRSTRSEISNKSEDVEAAIAEYRKLKEKMGASMSRYSDIVRSMDTRAEQVLKEFRRAQEELKKHGEGLARNTESGIAELNGRLDALRKEMAQKMGEMENLRTEVKQATDRILHAVDEAVTSQQSEFLKLMALALDNNVIPTLAPLTRLDIEVFVASHSDGGMTVLTPCISPDDRIGAAASHKSIDEALSTALSQSLKSWTSSDRAFNASLQQAIIRGNVLTRSNGLKALQTGLLELQRRQVLNEGVKEKLEFTWEKISGKCPRCGAETKGSKFCPQCGQVIAE
ncbi:MAG: hypothetical protein HXY34_12590 [Candidatus Thorarchaeota archaeon]|nr:hypothetical protein [Candidatus Thorarchaeota archaeon]